MRRDREMGSYYTDDIAFDGSESDGGDGLFGRTVDYAGIEDRILARRVSNETLRQRLARQLIEIDAAIVALSTQRARREEQLVRLARFPDEDPCEDGNVIVFDRTFPGSDKVYSYAARRADGRWYVTGERSPQGVTWGKLVDWMGLGVDEVHLVTGRRRAKIVG